MRDQQSVLIVGEDSYHQRNILNAARGLALGGWTVGLGSPAAGLAASSRHVRSWHRVPSPSSGLDLFVEALRRLVRDHGYEAVFAGGDAEVLALASAGDSLGVRAAYPPLPVAVRALDKLELERAAIQVGFAPLGTQPATDGALAEVDGPVVVKARLHWNPTRPAAPTRLESRIVPGQAAARARVAEIEATGGEPLLQSYLDGQAMAYNLVVARDGTVLAEYEQRTEREWHGTATRIRVVSTEREIAERAQALLRLVGWFGLAQLQFIVGPDGSARITDLNGRYYASIGFPVALGLNLPAIWAAAATGRSSSPYQAPRRGAHYLCFENDLLYALSVRERRVQEVMDVVRYRRGAVHSLWRRDDPWPAVRFMVNATLHVLRHAMVIAAGQLQRRRRV